MLIIFVMIIHVNNLSNSTLAMLATYVIAMTIPQVFRSYLYLLPWFSPMPLSHVDNNCMNRWGSCTACI